MNPIINNIREKDKILYFTIEKINVSLANALRRLILSEIPTVVIRTMPHAKNDVDIKINTTHFNNEILKQRLSCIPIHINDISIPLDEYILEINETNESDVIQYITTKHFKIQHNGKYLSTQALAKIFPPNYITNDHILFIRLRPKLSDNIPGESIHLTAKMSIGSAKESGTFNVVSTCSYSNTYDVEKQHQRWQEISKTLTNIPADEIEFKKKNWFLHDAKRIFIKDSFDFMIETIGVFTNQEIIQKATQILIEKLNKIIESIQSQTLIVNESPTTLENSFDIVLKNEDYTIGKTLEYILYQNHYIQSKQLSFIGFLKKHPHDVDSIIRLASKSSIDITIVKQYILETCNKAIDIFSKIYDDFM